MFFNQWMENENVLHLHYGILFNCKENEIVNFSGKCMKQEKIPLSEVTKTLKDKHCMTSLIGGS